MTYVPDPETLHRMRVAQQNLDNQPDPDQLPLPLDPACLVPVRRYRNTREVIKAHDYERKLWGHNKV